MDSNSYFMLKDNKNKPKHLLQFDGGSNPNPGPSAGAFVIYELESKEILREGGKYLTYGTNNIGEYTGLLEGMKVCLENGWKNILVEGDSKLVVCQVSKQWKINQPKLKEYFVEIQELLGQFETIGIRHIYREQNKRADSLSDETLENKQSWVRM